MCVCVCVLDGEGSWLFANTTLVVVWTAMSPTGYSDCLTGHSDCLTGYSDYLTGFRETLSLP